MEKQIDLQTYMVKAIERDISDERAVGKIPQDHILSADEIFSMLPTDLDPTMHISIVSIIFHGQSEVRNAVGGTGILNPLVSDSESSTAESDKQTVTQSANSETKEFLDHEAIFRRVQTVLIRELRGVGVEEITEDATLIGDLGAESIDFVSTSLTLEDAFHIRVNTDELFPHDPQVSLTSLWISPGVQFKGRFTDEGLNLLQEQFPHLSATEIEKTRGNLGLRNLPEIFTVGTIISYITRRLTEDFDPVQHSEFSVKTAD